MNSIKRFILPGNVKYFRSDEDVLIPEEYVEREKEVRGVWFSTVANIDVPKMKDTSEESIEELKKYLESVVDKLDEFNMNTCIFQVRPVNDALYDSIASPFSSVLTGTEGTNPGFDPLAFFIDKAKEKGISVHAWINPYRAGRVNITELGMTKEDFIATLDEKNFARVNPECTILSKQNKLLLDPSNDKVIAYVSDCCLELAARYDIKAIHIDDYFYPYEDIDDPDEEEKAKKAGYERIPDFRRSNVDKLIKAIHDKLQKVNKKVYFGISPFAIHRINSKFFNEEEIKDPSNINYDKAWDEGMDCAPGCTTCYANLYADVIKWMEEGWIDYVVPQDYWDLDNTTLGEDGVEKCVVRYADVAKWWNEMGLKYNKEIYIGHAIYRASDEGNWSNPDEIKNELLYNQTLEAVKGSIFFTYHNFTDEGNNALKAFRESIKDLWKNKVSDTL